MDLRNEVKLKSLGVTSGGIGQFRPCAYYLPRISQVIVARRDCSYSAERVTPWVDLHRENHRRWYLPWRLYVGFSVYYPRALSLKRMSGLITEVIPVQQVLDRILEEDQGAFGKERRRLCRLARGLTIKIEYEKK
jgi:hypothetical protein